MTLPVHITDHAVLRYLERAHGLDVEAVRLHLAGLAETGVRLGAIGVKIENIKLVLAHAPEIATVVTVLKAGWHTGGKRS